MAALIYISDCKYRIKKAVITADQLFQKKNSTDYVLLFNSSQSRLKFLCVSEMICIRFKVLTHNYGPPIVQSCVYILRGMFH